MDIKTENRKWKAAGRFPSEILFLTGFLTGTILPNMIWKMEWKQKTLASFYLIRNFAQKDISGGAYFGATERRVLFTADSVRFYSVRGAFVCCVHADPGTGNRDGPGNVCAGVRSLRRTGRSSASSAPVSDLCSCLFLAGRTCVSAVFWNLEKLWPVPRKKSSLPEAGDHCFWGIYRGDNGRMFSQSLVG